nr:DJ-1/PfpI family protein [Vibrio ichthyoenteri]
MSVAILVAEGSMPSAIAGIEDILSIANHLHGHTIFTIKQISAHQIGTSESFDVVFIPPATMGMTVKFDDKVMLNALTLLHHSGATLAANCASVFWLAQAGLLDLRSATTHWKLCDKLKEQYPQIVEVKKHQMVVDEGAIITGSGLFAFQDVTLHLIARYAGFELAREVADMCLLDFTGRLQAHYERFVPDYSHGDELVLRAQKYCEETPLAEQSNQAMAQVCCVSEKTLTRAFKKTYGLPLSSIAYALKWTWPKKRLAFIRRPLRKWLIWLAIMMSVTFPEYSKRSLALHLQNTVHANKEK